MLRPIKAYRFVDEEVISTDALLYQFGPEVCASLAVEGPSRAFWLLRSEVIEANPI